jgi:hypothetical protein
MFHFVKVPVSNFGEHVVVSTKDVNRYEISYGYRR